MDLLFRYFAYLLKTIKKHQIHSPLVSDLYTNVIKEKHPYYIFENIESVRSKMILSQSKISVSDFGTGRSTIRSVSSIAKKSLKSAKYGQLLFRLVNHFQPKMILELGTSFGITSCYLALANTSSQVTTIEGCPEIAKIAKNNFDLLSTTNIDLVVGSFDNMLHGELKKLNKLDFVFFDGNHNLGPTLDYFEQCLKRSHEDSVFIFDDIHWSKNMERAWDTIKTHPKVTSSIDLFELGIVLFRKEQKKQALSLLY